METQPGRKNAIINGNFDIWQRGISQTSAGYGSDDRWKNSSSGSTKVHSRQEFALGQTDVPNNPKYFSRTVVTSVVGANNYVANWQNVENVSTFAGETVTLSFWAKADSAKDIASDFIQYFGSGGSPSSDVIITANTHSLTTSWQKFTTTVIIPSISGKTLGTDSNDYTGVNFWFDAGSNFDARINSLGQQSGTFDIAQIQLEKGNTATEFENRPIGEELALCRRYYDVVNVGSSSTGNGGIIGSGNTTTNYYILPKMRTNPTISHNATTPAYYNGVWVTSGSTVFISTWGDSNVTAGVLNVAIGSGTDYLWRWSSSSSSELYLDAEL